ncbi:MAG: GDP-L-fucose synthase [Zetaproteobacteria bacterium]|nr:MAG: GDP-L-fucose synthase [Zetaproteobacteria bacterium]
MPCFTIDPSTPIFVAGHRGLVGSALVRALARRGCTNLLLRTSAELDLRDTAAVDAFFAETQPQLVLLAAARVGGILANDSYPADFIRDNLQIQTNVIDAARRFGCRKLLFLGSSCIYPRMAEQPIREEALLSGPLEPTNQWYAIAKIAGIKMCQAYRRQYGFDAISAMPTNLYGPNDNFDLERSHVLPAMIRKFHLARLAAEGAVDAIVADERKYGPIPNDILAALGLQRLPDGGLRGTGAPRVRLWGTGGVRRELLHVDDLARALLFLVEHYSGEEIVNVGCGEDCTIREMAEIVRAVVGFDGAVEWDRSRPDGTPRKLLDVTRITAMGWRPSIPLREGIAAVYREY